MDTQSSVLEEKEVTGKGTGESGIRVRLTRRRRVNTSATFDD